MSLTQKQKDLIEALKAGDLNKVGDLHDQGAKIIPVVRAVSALGKESPLLQPLATYLNERFGIWLSMTSRDIRLVILQEHEKLQSSLSDVLWNDFEVKKLLDAADLKRRYYIPHIPPELAAERAKLDKAMLTRQLEDAAEKAAKLRAEDAPETAKSASEEPAKELGKEFDVVAAARAMIASAEATVAEAKQLITQPSQPGHRLAKLRRSIGVKRYSLKNKIKGAAL